MSNYIDTDKLLYEPAPAVSAEFTKEFNLIVPVSPNGKDKALRYVWGMDRLEYVAGHKIRRYGDLDNDPPKYIGRGRWILEGWQSPDVYDKAEWLRDEKLLGPWPENGVWDFIEIHADSEGNYLPLNNSALDRARSWHFWKSKGDKRSIEHLLEQKMLRWSLQQQRAEEAKARVAQDFGEQIVDLFEKDTNPVSTSGTGGYTKTASGILVKQ